ncbi:MAG: hypothetical protein ABEK00_03460 [Candidatus Nanohaloarchaea archaeon]
MKKKVLLAVLVVGLTGVTAAQSFSQEQVQQANLTKYENTINNYTSELPGWIQNLIGDQDINIYVNQGQNNSFNISVKMDGLKVEQINDSALESPDIEVWTSTDVVEKVVESENPVSEMKKAINNDKIRYQANNTWTKVKIFFADLFMKLL